LLTATQLYLIMSRFYEDIEIINMLNEGIHESGEPKINSLSNEEEHGSVCSKISDTISSNEEGENEEYGNKPEESNVFVSRDGTQWNKIPFLITKMKAINIVKTKLQKVMLSLDIILETTENAFCLYFNKFIFDVIVKYSLVCY